MVVRIDLKDAGKHFGAMAEKRKKAIKRGLFSAALRTLEDIQTTIIPNSMPQPVDRGIYRAGWQVEEADEGVDIFNDVPHAAVIEFGVKPGMTRISSAMITALSEWVVRKGLDGGMNPVRVAFAIAKSMQANGVFNMGNGLKILEQAKLNYIPRNLETEVARELDED